MPNQQHKAVAITKENFNTCCDDAVAHFLSGDVKKFGDDCERLETFKVGTVRTLLNQEQNRLLETQGDQFNKRFNLVKDDDEEEEDSGEDAPMIMGTDGTSSLAKVGTSAEDYLAGMSRSLE